MNEDGFEKLQQRLDEVHEWPSVYLFKFIMKPEEAILLQVQAFFPEEAEILRKYSRTGKFVSLSVREVMMSSDEVLARYRKVAQIEGVMIL